MLFSIKNNSIEIKVKSFGAELCSVKSLDNNIEYLWQADSTVWARHAPNLFPIVGKLKNNSYSFQSQQYQLPQHGFARDNDFRCIEQTDTTLIFELAANEELKKVYPFHFSFQVKYTLAQNNVKVNYKVFNPSNQVLYFSVGAHPAFNCPLVNNETFEDYELYFPYNSELEINTLQDGLISEKTRTIKLINNTLPITTTLFDNDALIFSNNQIDEVRIQSTKSKNGITLKSKNWPYFGIWAKKGSNQFVCLEPWYGIADFENTTQNLIQKRGIIPLDSEQVFSCEYEMIFGNSPTPLPDRI